jgi:hypothetical protein
VITGSYPVIARLPGGTSSLPTKARNRRSGKRWFGNQLVHKASIDHASKQDGEDSQFANTMTCLRPALKVPSIFTGFRARYRSRLGKGGDPVFASLRSTFATKPIA